MCIRFILISGSLAALLYLTSCADRHPQADLVITRAVIWTADTARPVAEAIAIKNGRILAVGRHYAITPFIGDSTEVIDAGGRFVVPGFIDTHVHFITGGRNLQSVQLRNAATREAFISRLAAYARTLEPGEWITGGDWDHQLWGGHLPHRDWIDSVTGQHPVLINRLDGHMALANTLALEWLGLDEHTTIPGGELVQEGGRLTGILKEDAYYSQLGRLSAESPARLDDYARAAMRYVASHGVTTVHDMNGLADWRVFARLHSRGELLTRIYSFAPLPRWQRLLAVIDSAGQGDNWLRLGGLKGFVDGSLGSHTAAFFEPYSDTPGEHGYFVNPADSLYKWIKAADAAGLQVGVHAIGDSANHVLLNIYERVARENGPRDRRFRIEHAQHLAPTDISRFGRLGVIPAMQPYHAIDDGRWATAVIGPARSRTTYAFRSLLDSGAVLALGSDWFVAPPVPLLGIYAAVTRQTLDGRHPGGWVPQQKITVEEALYGYTLGAAYASFEEEDKGSLAAGKLADLVMLDKNLLAIPPDSIPSAQVVLTIAGGRKVYDAEVRQP